MYEIVMTATSNRTYYHKLQDHSLPTSNPASCIIENLEALEIEKIILNPLSMYLCLHCITVNNNNNKNN
jgi:hypothetical protein